MWVYYFWSSYVVVRTHIKMEEPVEIVVTRSTGLATPQYCQMIQPGAAENFQSYRRAYSPPR